MDPALARSGGSGQCRSEGPALRWVVHTRSLDRNAPLPPPPPVAHAVGAAVVRAKPAFALWPDCDARAFAGAAMRATEVRLRGARVASLWEWNAFCRALWVAGPRGPAPPAVRVAGAWDVYGSDAWEIGADAVWVVEHWWAVDGVCVRADEAAERLAAWRSGAPTNEGV